MSSRLRTWRTIQPDDEPDDDSTDRGEQEEPTGVHGRERAGHDRRDGNAVQHETRAVVHEALALDDQHELARDTEAAGDRGRGDRVGRRDDGAEDEGRRPRKPVDDLVRDDCHPDRRHRDEADREQPDRADIRFQLAERGEEGSAVQERRKHAEEDELRLELDLGHSRDDADREPSENEEDRVRNPESRRQREERRDRGEQAERYDPGLDFEMHPGIVPHDTCKPHPRLPVGRQVRVGFAF